MCATAFFAGSKLYFASLHVKLNTPNLLKKNYNVRKISIIAQAISTTEFLDQPTDSKPSMFFPPVRIEANAPVILPAIPTISS